MAVTIFKCFTQTIPNSDRNPKKIGFYFLHVIDKGSEAQ